MYANVVKKKDIVSFTYIFKTCDVDKNPEVKVSSK